MDSDLQCDGGTEFDDSFHTVVKCHKYTCSWKVENVSCMVDEFRCWSPLFPSNENSDTKWLLRIRVNADYADRRSPGKRFLSLFVKLQSSKEDSVLFVPRLAVDSGDPKVLEETKPVIIKRNTTWGSHKFALLSDCRDLDDSLKMYCEVRVPLRKTITDPPIPKIPLPACHLSQNLKELLSTGKLSDVTLVSSNKCEFKAHRAVLAARSPVFHAMFEHDSLEANSGRVVMSDTGSDVLSILLKFMYTGHLPLTFGDITDKLLTAADKYDLARLKAACEKELTARLTVSNAANTLILADEHQMNGMKECVQNFIRQNLDAVAATDSWKKAVLMNPQVVLELWCTMDEDED